VTDLTMARAAAERFGGGRSLSIARGPPAHRAGWRPFRRVLCGDDDEVQSADRATTTAGMTAEDRRRLPLPLDAW